MIRSAAPPSPVRGGRVNWGVLFLLLLLILPRPDGSELHYRLDRPNARPYPLVLLLQGSECASVQRPPYDDYARSLTGQGIAVLRIEKRGLTPSVTVCPEEYLRENTVPNRVLDCLQVLAHLRRSEPDWDRRLAVVGGSEGGLVAALVAPLAEETRAVVLIASGGAWPFERELLAELEKQGAPLDQVRTELEAMKQNPTWQLEWGSDGQLARNTYRWWASALPLSPGPSLISLNPDIPVLLVQGEDDPQCSPASVAELRAAMGPNLQVRRIAGLGHDFRNPLGRQALEETFGWIAERLKPETK